MNDAGAISTAAASNVKVKMKTKTTKSKTKTKIPFGHEVRIIHLHTL
jgi:hypothetical protein